MTESQREYLFLTSHNLSTTIPHTTEEKKKQLDKYPSAFDLCTTTKPTNHSIIMKIIHQKPPIHAADRQRQTERNEKKFVKYCKESHIEDEAR